MDLDELNRSLSFAEHNGIYRELLNPTLRERVLISRTFLLPKYEEHHLLTLLSLVTSLPPVPRKIYFFSVPIQN